MQLVRSSIRLIATCLVTFYISFLFAFSISIPAYSAPMGSIFSKQEAKQEAAAPSDPTQGEVQLKGIEKKAEEFLKPENTFSAEKIREESNKGLNEVQGDADFDKMNRSSDNKGPAVQKQVERALDKIQ